ncbi:MAG: hypothetical protein RLY20_2848 [Verrucomicrobiota bacterium]
MILLFERADLLSGGVILFMVVFMPWAFGTTQPWSIGLMNFCAAVLGALFAFKVWVRRFAGHQPLRFDTTDGFGCSGSRVLTVVLMAFTLGLLGYCVVAAVNARADYNPITLTLDYRDYIAWLPHTYHRAETWRSVIQYVAYAAAFWAVRDWLLGMSAEEARRARSGERAIRSVPARLQLLLWWLCLNAALVSVESIIQRLSGTDKLLFLVLPQVNPWGNCEFGPYAYRSNAAQYLNLVWPVALGLWWWRQRVEAARHSSFWHRHALLVCAVVIAAGPIISTSRAGALTAILMLGGAMIVFFTEGRASGLLKLSVFAICLIALAVGWYFGGSSLSDRLSEIGGGYATREAMYQTARLIAHDHPVFGTGPGTFEHMFQIYRQSHDEYWPAQLHNDWLELLLTFGWVGFGLILLALITVLAHSVFRAPIQSSSRFKWMLWLALAGCLLQARWDYPFRVYSVTWVFLLLCVILTVAGGKRR